MKLDQKFLINFGIHSITKGYFFKDFIIFIHLNIEALAFYFNLQNFFTGHCTRGDTWKIPIMADKLPQWPIPCVHPSEW